MALCAYRFFTHDTYTYCHGQTHLYLTVKPIDIGLSVRQPITTALPAHNKFKLYVYIYVHGFPENTCCQTKSAISFCVLCPLHYRRKICACVLHSLRTSFWFDSMYTCVTTDRPVSNVKNNNSVVGIGCMHGVNALMGLAMALCICRPIGFSFRKPLCLSTSMALWRSAYVTSRGSASYLNVHSFISLSLSLSLFCMQIQSSPAPGEKYTHSPPPPTHTHVLSVKLALPLECRVVLKKLTPLKRPWARAESLHAWPPHDPT